MGQSFVQLCRICRFHEGLQPSGKIALADEPGGKHETSPSWRLELVTAILTLFK